MSFDQLFQKINPNFSKKDLWIISIFILGVSLTFFPHLNYLFPFHIDEWFHIANAKQIALGYEINWYTNKPYILGLEQGWHLLLSGIYIIFNLSIKQWIFLPSILHVCAIGSTYIFVSKLFDKNHGLISAFFMAILPSNNTIGGPVFLIPVNLSLIIIPLALLFGFNLVKIKPIYRYALLIGLTTFLLYAHAPSAIVLLIILFVKSLLILFSKEKKYRIEGYYLLTSIFLSIIFSIPNFVQEILTRGVDSVAFNFYIKLDEIFFLYGILPTFLFIIGFYFASKTKSKEIWTLLITSLILLINIVIFAQLDLNLFLPYQRTFIPLFLLMAIISSIGLVKLLEINRPVKKTGFLIVISLLCVTGIVAVNTNLNYSYYQIIDQTDYENALIIKENTEQDDILILDPWIARAMAPIAERTVFAVSPFGPVEEEVKLMKKANEFLQGECRNSSFLNEYNISIVYARGFDCFNPNLEAIGNDIFLVKD